MKVDIFDMENRYDIIYADQPWAYLWGKGKICGNFCPEKHYKTMELSENCALGDTVKKIRTKNSALFIWMTMPCLKDVFSVIETWGFKYKTCAFTWIKTRKDSQPLAWHGKSYTKANAELCLLAMRGHIKSVDKTVPQVLMHPRLGHSVKPGEIMRRIEKLFGGNTKKSSCLHEEK
jgi:site-specific DNA-methyltransferase (adenine-specific)